MEGKISEYRNNGDLYAQLYHTSNSFVLKLCKDDNRFGRNMVTAISSALDDIERAMERDDSIKSSVLFTIGTGRFYSNGLNLSEFFSSNTEIGQNEHIIRLLEFIDAEFLPLLGRLLIFPIPTIALVNGHCFAGGLLFALSHDYRIGQSIHGFYCMNEMKIGLPMHPSMMSLLEKKIPRNRIIRDALLTAKRWDAKMALNDEIIDDISPDINSLVSHGKQFASNIVNLGYGGPNYSSIKQTMYAKTYHALVQGKTSNSPKL